MDKFGTGFVRKPPWLLLLNLGVKFSIYSISNPVMWICVLVLGKIFATEDAHSGAIVSQVVTSMGLMQSINVIGVVLFIAIGAGSNTYISRIFGRYKTSKKNYTLAQLADDKELKYMYGSTIFCFFLLCILLVPIILLIGPSVAKLQNFYLPSNYLKDIKILLVFYTLSLPFFGFVTINSYHLNSEGSAGWCAIVGILNIVFFVGFAFLFNAYQKTGGFGYYFNPSQPNEIIVFNIGCAILCSGVAMLIAQMMILYFLHLQQRSVIFKNLSSIFWVKWSIFKKIIRISLPIYVRLLVVFLAIILLNVALEFLRFPNGSSDFRLVKSPPGVHDLPPQKQLYATYWEYIIFSINSIFIIIYRIISSFSNTSIRATVGFYYAQRNFRKVYACIKACLIYCFIIIVLYEVTFTANATGILKSLFGLHNGGQYEVVYKNNIFYYQANNILNHGRTIFYIWNATIFVIAIQYMCPGIALTLGKLKITYFMFILDKIIIAIPLMTILLLLSFLINNNKNYILFFCYGSLADLITTVVSVYVFIRLIKYVRQLEKKWNKKFPEKKQLDLIKTDKSLVLTK